MKKQAKTSKTRPSWVIFNSKEDQQLFLNQKWKSFQETKTVSERLLFLRELQSSPEWRAIVSFSQKITKNTQDVDGITPESDRYFARLRTFENATSPMHFTRFLPVCFDKFEKLQRNFTDELSHIEKWLERNPQRIPTR